MRLSDLEQRDERSPSRDISGGRRGLCRAAAGERLRDRAGARTRTARPGRMARPAGGRAGGPAGPRGRCLRRQEGRDRGGDHLADGPPDPLHAGRGRRLRGARPLHDRASRPRRWATSASATRRASRASSGASRSGVVFVIAPWNYPYLTAVNAVIPALMAGNAVHPQAIGADAAHRRALRRSLRGRRPARRRVPASAPRAMRPPAGSSRAARSTSSASRARSPAATAVQEAAATRFIGTGLELGGKDPAYVRADADLAHAIENLVDGAFFNCGQSCCAIERIYVHADVYDSVRRRLGRAHPRLQARRSDRPRDHARSGGARRGRRARARPDRGCASLPAPGRILTAKAFPPRTRPGSAYLAPQVLTGVDHGNANHAEETFGPVVGVMRVERRRRGDPPDERQPLRPHRRDLDRGRGAPRSGSAIRSRPAPGS